MYRMLTELKEGGTWQDHHQDKGEDSNQGHMTTPKRKADEIQDCLMFLRAMTTMTTMRKMHTLGYHIIQASPGREIADAETAGSFMARRQWSRELSGFSRLSSRI